MIDSGLVELEFEILTLKKLGFLEEKLSEGSFRHKIGARGKYG